MQRKSTKLTGRPNFSKPSAKDREFIENRFSDYFDHCDAENAASKGDKIAKPYTLSGLLYHAGISKNEFTKLLDGTGKDIAGNALLRIESFIEENALSGKISSNAAMNSLKNNLSFGEQNQEAKEQGIREIRVTMDDCSEQYGK